MMLIFYLSVNTSIFQFVLFYGTSCFGYWTLDVVPNVIFLFFSFLFLFNFQFLLFKLLSWGSPQLFSHYFFLDFYSSCHVYIQDLLLPPPSGSVNIFVFIHHLC